MNKQNSQPEIEALGKQLEQHSGDCPCYHAVAEHPAQPPKACFPRICTGIPRTQKRSRNNAATSGNIFEDIHRNEVPHEQAAFLPLLRKSDLHSRKN